MVKVFYTDRSYIMIEEDQVEKYEKRLDWVRTEKLNKSDFSGCTSEKDCRCWEIKLEEESSTTKG